MSRVFISTVPFGSQDSAPLELLRTANLSYSINPLGRKLQPYELAELIAGSEILIAGTESITREAMENAPNLKLISRVGIGLDSVDLHAALDLGIKVAYTPDAPTKAVADLTIGLMINLLRGIHLSNNQIRLSTWERHMGRRLGDIKIGIIGVGRIGAEVLSRLQGFGIKKIYANDISPKHSMGNGFNIEWTSKEQIFRDCDLVTLHIPLTKSTLGLIGKKEMEMMKPDAVIINTSRGGIINEDDLYDVLSAGHLSGVALDVFEKEPYAGKLSSFQRCLLTAHMGSMTIDCRARMELEATEEAVRFIRKQPLLNEVNLEALR